jgi:peptidoglycan hydrolase-like protein with peptidoglycan-binding domain
MMFRRLSHPKYLLSLVLSSLILLLTLSVASASGLAMPGSKGHVVTEIQSYLHQLKYLKSAPTGYYGSMTVEAVKSFQMEHNLKSDGLVGADTLAALKEALSQKKTTVEYSVKQGDTLPGIAENFKTSTASIMAKNNLSSNELSEGQKLQINAGENPVHTVSSRSRFGIIQAIPWSIVNQLWKVGETARIIDLETGKSFQVKRLYGYYHSDTEPLTAQDTATLKEIYGGHWSWSRRAVIVQLRNQYIAASINGMPHGHRSIYNNNFPGQFCTHFLGSRIHLSGRVDKEHQTMVERAAEAELPSSLEYGEETAEPEPGAFSEPLTEKDLRTSSQE